MANSAVGLDDLAYTLAVRRESLAFRSFAVTDSVSSPLAPAPSKQAGTQPKVVFVFTGQGAQWPQMGKELLNTNQVFKDTIAQLGEHLKSAIPSLDWTIEGRFT